MIDTLIQRMFLALAIVIGLFVASAGFARAQGVTLRPHVTVTGPLVTLGDLFERAGGAASVAVFRAPDPGQTGTVRATRLEDVARMNGLSWYNDGLIAAVTVTRASQRIELNEVGDVIAKAIKQRMDVDPDDDLSVTFDGNARPMHAPAGADLSVKVERLELAASGNFTAELIAESNGVKTERVIYRGMAVQTIALPHVIRDIPRNAIVSSSDVEIKKVARSRLPRDVVFDMAEIVGQAARRNLSAGSLIRSIDLEVPKLVRRGDIITITFKKPGLNLSVRGRALGDGALGEAISVVNDRSNRVLEAAVTGAATVTVSPAGPTKIAAR